MADVADSWTKEQRLAQYNSNDYHPSTNPTGLDADGHIVNVPRMTADMATLGRELLAAAGMATAAAAQSDAWRKLEAGAGAVARVSATQISVVGDWRAMLTVHRAVRLSALSAESGWITAVAYDVGTGLTTITVRGFDVPEGVVEVWLGQELANAPNILSLLGQPGGVATLDEQGLLLESQALSVIRASRAGMIVEWESAVIPTLSDGLPMGLELDGAVASLATYPNLMRKWCGAGANATAPAWYRCTPAGVRDATGTHIRLQDRRGEFARGWDHGRGVDAGRALTSVQAADNAPHTHSVDPPGTWASIEDVNHTHSVDPPNTQTDTQGNHSHTQQIMVSGTTLALGSMGGWTTGQDQTGSAGSHAHNVNISAFNSGVQSVAHQHYVDIGAFNSDTQGTEGRPRNVAVMYIVLV